MRRARPLRRRLGDWLRRAGEGPTESERLLPSDRAKFFVY